MVVLLAQQNQLRNRNHHDSRNDSRRRPITVECGLLTDDNQEFYQVQREARFDIPSWVSINATIRKAQPKPQQQMDTKVVSSLLLSKDPRIENTIGFPIEYPIDPNDDQTNGA
ncbi:hypothetical protein PanWU01x14_194470 [Parasponia andersonii]|uniref:Uncharacterized protein n=1 Tax=Parasponia andersonii TaxID=3476 RepID=A0A2P5C0B4_PARAD|nr:hypothetical protein PanWU01x14_194470 [Parasponia andersonii]